MTQIIDGKAIAQAVREEVGSGVRRFVEAHGRAPALHVVLVGEDPASAVYVRSKEKAVVEAGMRGQVHRLPASTSEAALLELVLKLNLDPTVDGILVQLPLPAHIPVDAILHSVDPAKDVDITVRDGVLMIKAERSERKEEKSRTEFSYGSFVRSISLPAGADENDITATYDKGILTVSVGVSEAAAPQERRIEIKAEGN